MASIESLMVSRMITAAPAEPVVKVARRMGRNKVGAVLIVEGGVLRGLFSERDLLTRVVGKGRDPRTTKVGAVSSRHLMTVDLKAPLKEVLDLFRQGKFRHLPVVVDSNKPVGILSTRDFLEHLVQGLERYIDHLRYQHDLADGVDPYDHVGGAYTP